MMMRMLEAARMPVMEDHVRQADEDNPRGYYEFEAVKKIKEDQSWLPSAEGKVVKMVSMLLFDLPPGREYRVIFMRRDMREILSSQAKMLTRLGRNNSGEGDGKMSALFEAHLEKVRTWLAAQPNIRVLYVDYKNVLAHADAEARRIVEFLGKPLDVKAMKAVVDRSLYRNRAEPGSLRVWVLNPPFLKKFSRPQRSPAVTKSGTLYFPIWLAQTAGVLEAAGCDVTFTDAPARGISHQEALAQAGAMKPDLVVMDTSTPSIQNDLQFAEQLRSVLRDTLIVLVGTHVSALAEETLGNSSAVDAVARREHEYTIRDLCRLLSEKGTRPLKEEDLKTVAGLSFRCDGKIVHNPDRPPIEDLDELPWVSRVYRKHLQIRDYFNPNALYPMVTLMTGRGCPFGCSFCLYPQTFTGRKYRLRRIEDVVREMAFVKEAFPDARSIFFEDDTLTANKKRCLELAEAIRQSGISIPWTANARVDLDLETMQKIRSAGCRSLCVGFESGDQDTLNTMRKGIKREDMFQFMQDARAAGILIHGCFIVGFPGETRASIGKTIELAMALKPDTVQFYPVMAYPGTEAYDDYVKKGWLTARSYREWLTPEGLHNCVVRNENLTSAELVQLCDLARRKFYLRPTYILFKLGQMLRDPAEFVRTAKAARIFFKHLLFGSRV